MEWKKSAGEDHSIQGAFKVPYKLYSTFQRDPAAWYRLRLLFVGVLGFEANLKLVRRLNLRQVLPW